jgi:predicted nucleic-acid-binding Zn-ribbon protein
MTQKIKKIYICPKCKSDDLKEKTIDDISITLARFYKNNNISKRDSKIFCEKCKSEFDYYNELLSEISSDCIEKKLINWLKDYFSKYSFRNDHFEKEITEKFFAIYIYSVFHSL